MSTNRELLERCFDYLMNVQEGDCEASSDCGCERCNLGRAVKRELDALNPATRQPTIDLIRRDEALDAIRSAPAEDYYAADALSVALANVAGLIRHGATFLAHPTQEAER